VRFKTDENLPEEVAESLREAGHEASTILEQGLGGEPDPDVASLCRLEQRSLITLELGFADIRTYPPREYPGLVILRPGHQSKARVIRLFEQALPILETEPLAGRLLIVEEERIRIRE
jgi:predicted nuclease of predicted toxin-antitoxin system